MLPEELHIHQRRIQALLAFDVQNIVRQHYSLEQAAYPPRVETAFPPERRKYPLRVFSPVRRCGYPVLQRVFCRPASGMTPGYRGGKKSRRGALVLRSPRPGAAAVAGSVQSRQSRRAVHVHRENAGALFRRAASGGAPRELLVFAGVVSQVYTLTLVGHIPLSEISLDTRLVLRRHMLEVPHYRPTPGVDHGGGRQVKAVTARKRTSAVHIPPEGGIYLPRPLPCGVPCKAGVQVRELLSGDDRPRLVRHGIPVARKLRYVHSAGSEAVLACCHDHGSGGYNDFLASVLRKSSGTCHGVPRFYQLCYHHPVQKLYPLLFPPAAQLHRHLSVLQGYHAQHRRRVRAGFRLSLRGNEAVELRHIRWKFLLRAGKLHAPVPHIFVHAPGLLQHRPQPQAVIEILSVPDKCPYGGIDICAPLGIKYI